MDINEPQYIEISQSELREALLSYIVETGKSPYGIMSVILDLHGKYVPDTYIFDERQRIVITVGHERYV